MHRLNGFIESIKHKSNAEANEYREEGNKNFRKFNYLDALIFYNKSICFANSKDIEALGYANRSAVFMEIERYDESLKNIQWARENGYPPDKIMKLIEREEKCKKWMEVKTEEAENPQDFFKLSYPANEKVPWVVDCVEVKTTREFGRGIYAKCDLKAGDIICIEEPVVNMIRNDDSVYKHCFNCFKVAMMNLIPCDRTASLMFCSAECKEKTYSKAIDFGHIVCNDVKILTELVDGVGGLKNLEVSLQAVKLINHNATIFDYDFSNPDNPKYVKNLMMCLLSLQSKPAFLSYEIVNNSETIASKEIADFILGLFFNNEKLHFYHSNYAKHHDDGFFISLFGSLLNHACVNNAEFISLDNKIVTMISKPIKAGEQIFICYFNQNVLDRDEHKDMILKHHEFKCKCRECTDKSYKVIRPDCHEVPLQILNRKCFKKLLEYFKENQFDLNSGSNSHQEIENYSHNIFFVMQLFAYFSTFPC